MSNTRYALVTAADVSRRFHELLKELELAGFTVVLREEGGFAGRALLSTERGAVDVVVRGRASESGLEAVVDILDPPTHHVPQAVCDQLALKLAGVFARALGAEVRVGSLGPLPSGALGQGVGRGEVVVRRVPCG
jgi:hypothetical protein